MRPWPRVCSSPSSCLPRRTFSSTGTAVFAAIAVRHALRYRGHPWMNPAASGILVGTVILGLAPAWWIALGSYGTYLMIALGVVLAARTWRSWRLPVTFVVAYALFVTAQHLMVGTSISPHVLMLEAIDPVMLFFGLFLVTEPRTSPADLAGQALYAMGVALGAAMLPLVLPTVGILVALLLGNLGFLAFRWARATSLARPSARGATSKRKRDSPAAPAVRWPSAYRTGTMFLVLMVLFAVLASSPRPDPATLERWLRRLWGRRRRGWRGRWTAPHQLRQGQPCHSREYPLLPSFGPGPLRHPFVQRQYQPRRILRPGEPRHRHGDRPLRGLRVRRVQRGRLRRERLRSVVAAPELPPSRPVPCGSRTYAPGTWVGSMTETASGPRHVQAPRGSTITCRGWPQEAALRLLMNNLDPEVARDPDHLIVYGGRGKAARSWNAFDHIVATLRTLRDDQTLLVQSGKAVGVFPTHPEAPRVLIANANLVPRWATEEVFWDLEAKGLTMFGQMTAGSWIYIGTQGILQGTYETLASLARLEFHAEDLVGRWLLSSGLGEMGGAQPLAVTLLGGVCLIVDVDPRAIHRQLSHHYLDAQAADLDDALRQIGEARAARRALSVGLDANAADVYPELVHRGVVPDIVSDQTAAHDIRVGYIPQGLSVESAAELRGRDLTGYLVRVRASIATEARAILDLQRMGAHAFDYGNNFRTQARESGVTNAFEIPGYVPRYIRPLFAVGSGPFRWVALSGEPDDIRRVDRMILREVLGAHLLVPLDPPRR